MSTYGTTKYYPYIYFILIFLLLFRTITSILLNNVIWDNLLTFKGIVFHLFLLRFLFHKQVIRGI